MPEAIQTLYSPYRFAETVGLSKEEQVPWADEADLTVCPELWGEVNGVEKETLPVGSAGT